MFTIDFEPVGRRGKFSSEQSLLDCARSLKVDIVSICGGGGSCERCKVQLISGQLSELTSEEVFVLSEQEVAQGYRLACLAYPLSDVKLNVPPDSLSALQRTQVEGLEVEVDLDPPLLGFELHLEKTELDALQADSAAVRAALAGQGFNRDIIFDMRVAQELSPLLRKCDWQISAAVRGEEIVAVGAPGTRWLGLAVDIGTTKIAGYLLDPLTGEVLASKGVMNPQIAYGEDVVARIAYAGKSGEDAALMQSLLAEALNHLGADLCAETGFVPEQIAEVVAVGNTVIHHLFLGLPVAQLGVAPYVPAVDSAVDVKCREIGLKFAPGAYLHTLPIIAGYVGADHVAMLLATQLDERSETVLAIDIGTNTEICLTHKSQMKSVSCASGPAFEGAHIKFGMRAAPGAIEHAKFIDGELEIQTIGGEPAIGICGSGLLDIVAQLRLNGVISEGGRLLDHPLVRKDNGGTEVVLAERTGAEPVVITQKDIRELQLAKAAISLGIQALLEDAGLEAGDLDRVIVAGAFGTYIDVASAITIGMLPDIPLERFRQVGNAAGTGARLALISQNERQRAIRIAARDGYIELAKLDDFNHKYTQATYMAP